MNHLDGVAVQALNLLANFQTSFSLVPNLSGLKWILSSQSVIKLNVDGAVFFDHQRSGMSCVLLDAQGQVIMATTSPKNLLEDPLTIELLAIFQGL